MEQTIKELAINGKTYVEKGSEKCGLASCAEGFPYVIARTYSAGVFAGYLKSRQGKEAELLNARRIWKWTGAASLSQLAMSGTSSPKTCMFPEPVHRVVLTEVIEILDVTEKARNSIDEVPVWKA